MRGRLPPRQPIIKSFHRAVESLPSWILTAERMDIPMIIERCGLDPIIVMPRFTGDPPSTGAMRLVDCDVCNAPCWENQDIRRERHRFPESPAVCTNCGSARLRQELDPWKVTSTPHLWITEASSPPASHRFCPPKNPVSSTTFVHKPTGCLWTSPHLGNQASAWVQHLRAKVIDTPPWHAWLLHASPRAKIYIIDRPQDLDRLATLYPCRADYPFLGIDFESMSSSFDAIHVTAQGIAATRFRWGDPHLPNLDGWNTESTLWLTWCFNRIEYLGELTFDAADHVDEVPPTPTPHRAKVPSC